MLHLDYQRTIIAYHGCDEALADRVLRTGETLKVSENDYDWLGSGIYFWEFGPDRAMAWAEELHRRFPKRVVRPAVLGAVIQLGTCFDLLDTQHTAMLKVAYDDYVEGAPHPLPANKGLMHRLDCAVINYAVPWIEQLSNCTFQTVRGVFQEGRPVLNEAATRG